MDNGCSNIGDRCYIVKQQIKCILDCFTDDLFSGVLVEGAPLNSK